MTSRAPRHYEPDFIKCECGNDTFKIEWVTGPKYPENRTREFVNRSYATCTKCRMSRQV